MPRARSCRLNTACSAWSASASNAPAGTAGTARELTQLARQRDQLVLGTVVEVALDATALLVLSRDQALPRHLQLLGPLSQFLQTGCHLAEQQRGCRVPALPRGR